MIGDKAKAFITGEDGVYAWDGTSAQWDRFQAGSLADLEALQQENADLTRKLDDKNYMCPLHGDTIRKLLEEIGCTCEPTIDGMCDTCAALAELENLELASLPKVEKEE